jgi:hypothetical protein
MLHFEEDSFEPPKRVMLLVRPFGATLELQDLQGHPSLPDMVGKEC